MRRYVRAALAPSLEGSVATFFANQKNQRESFPRTRESIRCLGKVGPHGSLRARE